MVVGGLVGSIVWHRKVSAPLELATGTMLKPSRELADFSLTDHHGRPFGLSNLRGHWSLMFFGYTNCPDFCPTTLTTLAALDKKLRAEAFTPLPQVVFVSVDSKRDTPEQLARYVPYFNPEFIGVTAQSQDAIESIAAKLGIAVVITPQKDGSYTVDHSGVVLVVSPEGRLAAILSGPLTVDGVSRDWHRLVSGEA